MLKKYSHLKHGSGSNGSGGAPLADAFPNRWPPKRSFLNEQGHCCLIVCFARRGPMISPAKSVDSVPSTPLHGIFTHTRPDCMLVFWLALMSC